MNPAKVHHLQIGICVYIVLLILIFSANYYGTGSASKGDLADIYSPHGVEVDTLGNVYISDTRNLVQKFDNNGKFILKWGSNGTADGQFKYPSGLAVDSSGNVFVSDEGNKNVQKFDSDGKFMTKWGSRGYGDGKFKHNHYIAVDSSGNVYVSDRDYGYVQIFDNNGKFITRWTSETKETDG